MMTVVSNVANRILDEALHSGNMGILSWLWHPELQPFRRDARFGPFTSRLDWNVFGSQDGFDLQGGQLRKNL
jgi:hypothetical protein